MVAVLLLATLLQTSKEEDYPPLPQLRWLARHQALDGSWGTRPKDCTCPPEPAPSSVTADGAKVRDWLRAVSADDLATRDTAMRALELAGQSVVPAVRAELEVTRSDEARERLRAVLERLDFIERNALEVTALALHVLFGQVAPDRVLAAGRTAQQVRNAGLSWLMAQPQGGPASGVSLGQALAAAALERSTAEDPFRERRKHADAARSALVARQNESGAWGPGRDDVLVTRAVLGLICPDDSARAVEKGREWLRQMAMKGDVMAQACGLDFHEALFADQDEKAFRDSFAKFDVAKLDPLLRHPTSHALFMRRNVFGNASLEDERWKEWHARLLPLLMAHERSPGCTQGSVGARGPRVWATAWRAYESSILYRRW